MPPMAPAPRTTKRMRALCHRPPWQAFRVAATCMHSNVPPRSAERGRNPLRLVGGLAAPARAVWSAASGGPSAYGERARRHLVGPRRGLPPTRRGRPPGARRPVRHAHRGVSALLLQTLHPLAMAGVADHSGYRDDPSGRLRRTAGFVGTTTFGTTAQADGCGGPGPRVHRRVKGISPDGRAYSADDPELVTFIHVAEVSSFLGLVPALRTAATRPHRGRDQYYEELAPGRLQPRALSGCRTRPTRRRLPAATAARALHRSAGPPGPGLAVARRRPAARASAPCTPSWWPAAVGVLPGLGAPRARSLRRGPLDLMVDTPAVTPITRMLADAVRWMMPPPM